MGIVSIKLKSIKDNIDLLTSEIDKSSQSGPQKVVDCLNELQEVTSKACDTIRCLNNKQATKGKTKKKK